MRVQISSTEDESEAKGNAESLKTKGLSAYYVKFFAQDSIKYRTCIGLFKHKKDADAYHEELVKNKILLTTGIVVKFIRWSFQIYAAVPPLGGFLCKYL